MAELLLELLSEEIPARMQARAADDLKRLVSDGLKAAGLEFKDALAFATPRRLALVVDGLPTARADVSEERRGPRVGAPEQAVQGFLKATGLTSLDQAEAGRSGRSVDEVRAASYAAIPAGRYGRVDEFGPVVAFLSSAQASYISGSAVRCDGGLIAGL